MRKIFLRGCNGRMGQVVSSICASRDDVQIVAGLDFIAVKKNSYPVYADPMEFTGSADVVIDFSNPIGIETLLDYCVKKNLPLVLATTGFDSEMNAKIEKASESIPVFRSYNMSLGINLLADLLKKAASILGADYDVEIIERHHNQKIDAPSGTALMLYDAVSEALPYKSEAVYDRHAQRSKRDKKEIGIHAIRGGTIVGEHEIVFAGRDEVITLSHSATSREVFAVGAVRAALFLAGVKKAGLYNMDDIINLK